MARVAAPALQGHAGAGEQQRGLGRLGQRPGGSDADRAKLEELNPNRAAFVANFGSAHTWKGAHVPALQVFAPPPGVTATGAACVVAPGGGYGFLAPHEGMAVAAWLAQNSDTTPDARARFAAHLTQQYMCSVLDALPSPDADTSAEPSAENATLATKRSCARTALAQHLSFHT